MQTWQQSFVEAKKKFLRKTVALNTFTENADGINELGNLTAEWFKTKVDSNFSALLVPSQNEDYGNHIVLSKRSDQLENRSNIALVSHLDTVYPSGKDCIWDGTWKEHHGEDNSWILGPGIMDIKGGTFMIAAVLHTLKIVYPEVFASLDWHILLNASEEVMASDFADVCNNVLLSEGDKKSSSSCLGCLIFEAGNFSNNQKGNINNAGFYPEYTLVTSRKGMCVWMVTVIGVSAHAGNAHQKGALTAKFKKGSCHQHVMQKSVIERLIRYDCDIFSHVKVQAQLLQLVILL